MTDAKSEADLGWRALVEHLVSRCHTNRGAARAAELGPLQNQEEATVRQAEIGEARGLQDRGEALSFGGICDVAPALDRSAKGGVLDPDALCDIASTLLAALRLRRHILSRATVLPRLAGHALLLAELPEVTGPISDSFDEQRKLRDNASPALSGLRQRVAHLLGELGRRTDSLLNEPHIAPHLQDRFVTQREERYVVPVRADARTRVRGIVHGVSASGATVFVEPDEIIELNNRLKLAHLEVEEEERRILTELSQAVERAAPRIQSTLDILADLDLIDAAARLSVDLRAQPVNLGHSALDLRNARHPLMVLAGVKVVPNDIVLPQGGTLIISGPNAGGKTVALKLTGLFLLMARAGLHLPVQEGSALPWFTEVLTDVGDDQSLEKNLSTFSAHIHNLRRFLEKSGPATLVLLDEIAVGTDPTQGAALAQGMLEALAAAGATVLVTTHYDRLKALGQAGPPFFNASVGYDLERLAPTYRLHLGIPGASLALSVAARLGLPQTIVERANALLAPEQGGLDTLLQALGNERERLEALRREALEMRAEAKSQAEQATELKKQAQATLARARQQAHDEAIDALRTARRELLETRSALKAQAQRLREQSEPDKAAPEELSRLKRRIDALSSEVAAQAPPKQGPVGRAPRADELHIGARVYVPRLGGIGTVMSDCVRDKVVVQVGALRLNVDRNELLLPEAIGHGEGRQAPSPQLSPLVAAASPIPPRTPDATLDLRGERAHIAIARAEKFLDDALRESRPAVFLLHGHGTGVLRQALRSHFASFPGVRKMRAADPGDGGDGVTLLELDV